MDLSDPVSSLPQIGDYHSQLLRKLGVANVRDLLYYFPSHYRDFSLISRICDLQVGETATVIGVAAEFKFIPTRKRGFTIQEAVIDDGSGKIKLKWFNQPFLRQTIKEELTISISGLVGREGIWLAMENPEYEIVKGSALAIQGRALIHTGRLVPIYPETKGLTSKWIRTKIALLLGILPWYQGQYQVINKIEEWLPAATIDQEKLIDLRSALSEIHFPSSFNSAESAKKRLGFDELLMYQLEAHIRRQQWKSKGQAKAIQYSEFGIQNLVKSLPFILTGDQTKAIDEILTDLSKTTPMNRLLQGDVGSGKTVVAAAAALMVIKSGYQAAFMAPTQVLADQHEKTLTDLLTPFGVKVALLTGATKQISKGSALASQGRAFSQNKPDLIIGTHALIHKRAKLLIDKKRLALVIIDEQHRFGVHQRAKLVASGIHPHVLSMTATPIPRTISLSKYADLDISLIRQMPAGRLAVKTWLVPESKREHAYGWIEKQIIENRAQVFVVCPLINISEVETLATVKAATKEHELLTQKFKGLKVSLLHGKMKPEKKTQTLEAMKNKQINILVATAVVEVGVDVPNATIIMIEGAQRFGLAQLHQLRGRVGRNNKQAYCLLFTSNNLESKRLKALETNNDGMTLAELDLKWRGPGSLWGAAQHGWPELKLADLSDLSLVRHVFNIASRLVENLDSYPVIKSIIAPLLDKSVVEN